MLSHEIWYFGWPRPPFKSPLMQVALAQVRVQDDRNVSPAVFFQDMAFPTRHRVFWWIVTSLTKSDMRSREELVFEPTHIDGAMGQTFSQHNTPIASEDMIPLSMVDTRNIGSFQKPCISVSRAGSSGNALVRRLSGSRPYAYFHFFVLWLKFVSGRPQNTS